MGIKKITYILITLTLLIMNISCTNLVKEKYIINDKNIPKSSTLFISSINIEAFNCYNKEEIKTIYKSKLNDKFLSTGLKITNNINKADYVLNTDIKINIYQESFNEKKYYKFTFSLMNKNANMSIYIYEYSGEKSIFDLSIMNNIANDLIKQISKGIL